MMQSPTAEGGLTRVRLGDIDGAIADFNRAIQPDPNCTQAYPNIAFEQFKSNGLVHEPTIWAY